MAKAERSPLGTALSVTIHRIKGSKEATPLLNRCGVGIPCTDVHDLNSKWAKSITMEHKKMLPPVLSKVGVYTSRLITQMVNNRHRHAHKPLITLLVWWAFLYNPWGFYNWNNNQPRSESQRWSNARWIQYQLADNRYIHQDESHNGKAQSYTEENIRYPDLFNSQRD